MTKQGKRRWISVDATAISIGEQPLVLTTMRDITERK